MSLINDFIVNGAHKDGSPISEEDFVQEMQKIGEDGFLLQTDIFMTSIKSTVDLFNQLVQTGVFSEVDLQGVVAPMQQVSNLFTFHRIFFAHYVGKNGNLPENLTFEKYVRVLYNARATMFQLLDIIEDMKNQYEQARQQEILRQQLQQQQPPKDNSSDKDDDGGDDGNTPPKS